MFIAERLGKDKHREGSWELHMKRLLMPWVRVIFLEEET